MNGKPGKGAAEKLAPSMRNAAPDRRSPALKPIDAANRGAAELHTILGKFFQTRGPVLGALAEALVARLRAGGKVLIFGNGGSAAEAQHFAAELVNGVSRHDRPAVPAVALTTDTSSLTAIGNDRGFAEVFSRQIEALGKPGDVVMALTTSGTSDNVIKGLKTARAAGLMTVALTGGNVERVGALSDFLLDVPSCVTPRIQEAHLFLLHFLAGKLEDRA